MSVSGGCRSAPTMWRILLVPRQLITERTDRMDTIDPFLRASIVQVAQLLEAHHNVSRMHIEPAMGVFECACVSCPRNRAVMSNGCIAMQMLITMVTTQRHYVLVCVCAASFLTTAYFLTIV